MTRTDRRRALMMADRTLYIYNHGDECINVTGGWVSEAKRPFTTSYAPPSRAPGIFREENMMHVSQMDDAGVHYIGFGTVFPSVPVDFSAYKTLVVDGRFEASYYGIASVIITPYPAESIYSPSTKIVGAYGNIVDTISEFDISDLSGLWLVGIVSSVSQARAEWKKDAYIRAIYFK